MNGIQRAAVRTINGTIQVGARLWRWPWETKAGRERIGRLGALVMSVYSLYRLSGRWHWVGAVAIAVALVYAYCCADPVDAEPDDAQDDDDQDGFEVEELDPEQLRAALIHAVRTLAVGRGQGAHLDLILAGWKDAGLAEPELSLSAFRQLVEQLGVPVRSSLKVQGLVRIGVHLDDLPPLPAPVVPDLTPGAPQTPPPVAPDDLFQDW